MSRLWGSFVKFCVTSFKEEININYTKGLLKKLNLT